jgi:DNA polymerase-1
LYGQRSELTDIWYQVSHLLYNNEIGKIGQNFKFDEKQLISCINGTCNFGMKTRGFHFDTLLAFRTLYPELPGSLQFSTSVLTEEPYYKDEGKEYNPNKDSFDRLLLYNAKDAAVTYEVFERECEELKDRGLEEFFYRQVMPLHYFYSRIESRGILRDNYERHFLREKYTNQCEEFQSELNSLTLEYTDEPINVNSNSAKGDVPRLVYGYMRCPARKGVDDLTLDSLRRNILKDPKKKRILELISLIRKVRKTIGTYIDAKVDYRERLLTGYRIMLETGRTSTSVLKAPVTTEPMGVAFQTITKHGETGSDIRRMFIPDKGYIFVEPDLSGAEARVVAILANDSRLLKAFKYGIDIHRLTRAWIDLRAPRELDAFWEETGESEAIGLASRINKELKASISDEERHIGKTFRHASNYDMGKREAAIQAQVSEFKAGKILEAVHRTNPNIRAVFHYEIQEALKRDRTLVSPNGRTRLFLNKWGNDLFKEAYAQIPQSTVSDQTKKAGMKIEKRCPEVQILMECHDSLLLQVPFSRFESTLPIIKEEMEAPIDFSKCTLQRGELIIPCEIKYSDKSWYDMQEIRI